MAIRKKSLTEGLLLINGLDKKKFSRLPQSGTAVLHFLSKMWFVTWLPVKIQTKHNFVYRTLPLFHFNLHRMKHKM